MNIEPFKAWHLHELALQPSQAHFSDFFDPKYGPSLEAGGPAFTGLDNGQVVGCCGLVKHWENRATAWALLGDTSGRNFVSIHKAVARFLDMSDFRRIECYVDAGFEEGHRWVKMLDFQPEGYMKAFSPMGDDAVLYARVI